jgi:hypothetical protein
MCVRPHRLVVVQKDGDALACIKQEKKGAPAGKPKPLIDSFPIQPEFSKKFLFLAFS